MSSHHIVSSEAIKQSDPEMNETIKNQPFPSPLERIGERLSNPNIKQTIQHKRESTGVKMKANNRHNQTLGKPWTQHKASQKGQQSDHPSRHRLTGASNFPPKTKPHWCQSATKRDKRAKTNPPTTMPHLKQGTLTIKAVQRTSSASLRRQMLGGDNRPHPMELDDAMPMDPK
jgi:hypothetical protein